MTENVTSKTDERLERQNALTDRERAREQRERDAVEGNTHGKNKWAILFTVLIMTFIRKARVGKGR